MNLPVSENIQAGIEKFCSKERIPMLVMIILAAALMGWIYWIDPLNLEIDKTRQQLSKLEKKIENIRPERYISKIKKTEAEYLGLKTTAEHVRSLLKRLAKRAQEYDFAWFDDERFLNFLEAVLRKSVELNMRVDRIEDFGKKPAKYIGITIKPKYGNAGLFMESEQAIIGSGSFISVIKLVNYIESFNILTVVKQVRVWYDSEEHEMKFDIRLACYGMER